MKNQGEVLTVYFQVPQGRALVSVEAFSMLRAIANYLLGPAYSSKMTRSGLRMCDLFDEEVFEKKLRRVAAGYQKRFGDLLKYDVEEEIARYKVRTTSTAYRPHLECLHAAA